MRLFLVGLSACLLSAPALAQKFVSVTGDSTRMTVGAIAAEETAPPAETEAEVAAESDTGETEIAEEEVAEAEADLIPEEINFGDAVDTFIPGAGECNPGTVWNQTTGRCETF